MNESTSNAAAIELERILDKADPELSFSDETSVIDSMYGVRAAQAICHGLAAHSGWWIDTETGEDVRTWPQKFVKLWVMAKLALVHSEVSEGVEGYRKGKMDDHLPHRDMLEVELADAVIRILDLAGGFGMDIGGAMIEKLAYNQKRADHSVESRIADGGKSV
jgi:NTP pyrophosphatase (non-canonical NTP hydrolase)